jgi:hypothetical protein
LNLSVVFKTARTLNLTTLSIMKLSIMGLNATFSMNDTQHNNFKHQAAYILSHVYCYCMLSVIMLSVILLSVIILSVIMLSVIMLSVIMLSVIMLTIIMINVLAPNGYLQKLMLVSTQLQLTIELYHIRA